MEEWRAIPDVDGYSVSSHGKVRNDSTLRILKQSQNRIGVCFVGIYSGGIQRSFSVGLLVAKVFIPKPNLRAFDTPIHLDGNKTNNHVDNLLWRPRWFAVMYARQFKEDLIGKKLLVQELDTEEIMTAWEMSIKYGLLLKEIKISARSDGDEEVWPTRQRFRYV